MLPCWCCLPSLQPRKCNSQHAYLQWFEADNQHYPFTCSLLCRAYHPSSPITQLQLQAGGDVLSALAGQLGVPVAQLVYWGRVGARRALYVATPQERRSADSSTTSEAA